MEYTHLGDGWELMRICPDRLVSAQFQSNGSTLYSYTSTIKKPKARKLKFYYKHPKLCQAYLYTDVKRV